MAWRSSVLRLHPNWGKCWQRCPQRQSCGDTAVNSRGCGQKVWPIFRGWSWLVELVCRQQLIDWGDVVSIPGHILLKRIFKSKWLEWERQSPHFCVKGFVGKFKSSFWKLRQAQGKCYCVSVVQILRRSLSRFSLISLQYLIRSDQTFYCHFMWFVVGLRSL